MENKKMQVIISTAIRFTTEADVAAYKALSFIQRFPETGRCDHDDGLHDDIPVYVEFVGHAFYDLCFYNIQILLHIRTIAPS